ncbi:Alpha/Beta hydrolase protein [Mycena epipterygia]|nr:Alpha/Beta hydrolase protein [Mycena epipterygia]
MDRQGTRKPLPLNWTIWLPPGAPFIRHETAVQLKKLLRCSSNGTFKGIYDGNLTKFLGVPFSRPTRVLCVYNCFFFPIMIHCSARFELPQTPTPLDGLQDATSFGPACPQQAESPVTVPFTVSVNHTLISEACSFPLCQSEFNPNQFSTGLTLDVFVPVAARPGSKLPILVWLFGGGFEVGNSADTDVRGAVERSTLLGEPVIIVAPNYRVSPFGFLAGKEVSDGGITNLGLRDQIFALKWVQKHIAAFGGDPERVVLGGISAGSVSTALLLLSNKHSSSSLFRGAFMVSGSPWPSPTVADGQRHYDELVVANNCTKAPDTLDCLRHIPFDAFLATMNRTPDFFAYRSLALVWRPRVDRDTILRNPIDSVVQGAFARVRRLSNTFDPSATLIISCVNIGPHRNVLSYLSGATPAQISRIAELYPQDPKQGSPFGTGLANQVTPEFKRIAAFGGDFFFNGLRRLLVQHTSATQNTWSWLSKRGKSTPEVGAFHSSDLTLFFPSNTTRPLCSVNFINTLDPNQSAAPRAQGSNSSVFWPKWQTPSAEGSSSLLTFSDPAVVNVTADDSRAGPIQFLIDLHVEGVSLVGLGL